MSGNSPEQYTQTRATAGWQWPVVLLLAAIASAVVVLLGEASARGDELDIIRPAFAYVAGDMLREVKYPSFPFYFYGIFLNLLSTPDDHTRSLMVARWVHAAIGAGNLILMYLFACRLFSRGWALLTALFYAAIPVVALSAAEVKTESLQMMEVLISLIALQGILREPRNRKWHVVAGGAAALAVATKLNFFPALLYGLQLLYMQRRGERVPRRAVTTFVLSGAGVTLLSFTNLWIFDEIVAHWLKDQYFQPNASLLRAVPETFAFPYGRYSYFFSSTLPLALGWPLLLLAVAFSLGRPRDSWLHRVFGLGTLIYLLLMLSGTMLRVAHSFTPFLPYFAVAAVACLQGLAQRSRALPVLGALLVLGYAGWLFSGVPAMRAAERERDRAMQTHMGRPGSMLLTSSERPDKDSVPIRSTVEQARPQQIVLVNSYFLNMCKYRNSALYADNCAYYRELIAGKEGYAVQQAIPARIPGAALQLDPELRRMTYYLLTRNSD